MVELIPGCKVCRESFAKRVFLGYTSLPATLMELRTSCKRPMMHLLNCNSILFRALPRTCCHSDLRRRCPTSYMFLTLQLLGGRSLPGRPPHKQVTLNDRRWAAHVAASGLQATAQVLGKEANRGVEPHGRPPKRNMTCGHHPSQAVDCVKSSRLLEGLSWSRSPEPLPSGKDAFTLSISCVRSVF